MGGNGTVTGLRCCPSCGGEFQAWVASCPDCGVTLEECATQDETPPPSVDGVPEGDTVAVRAGSVQRAAVVVGAGLALMLAGWMVIAGLDQMSSTYARSGDESVDPVATGGLLLLAAFVVLAWVVLTTRPMAALPPSGWRCVAAGVVALGVGLVAVILGDRFGGWVADVGLFVTIAACVTTLVPPRSARWLVGLALGLGIAAALGDSPMLGVVLALVALGIGELLSSPASPSVNLRRH